MRLDEPGLGEDLIGQGNISGQELPRLRIWSALIKQLMKRCMTPWAWMHTNAGRNIRRTDKHLNIGKLRMSSSYLTLPELLPWWISCVRGLQRVTVFYRDHESKWRAVSHHCKFESLLTFMQFLKLPRTTTESWWMDPFQMSFQIAEEDGNPNSER